MRNVEYRKGPRVWPGHDGSTNGRRLRIPYWLVVALIPLGSEAQPRCGPTPGVIEALTDGEYQERQGGSGLNASGTVVALYVNPETGTWTLLESFASGVTCLRASGTYWEFDEVENGDEL